VAELRDASPPVGQERLGRPRRRSRRPPGPAAARLQHRLAGENQVLFAAVVNDLHRAAGRSGVGAVMGSKNLKAIAVRGTKGVGNIADPKAFMKVTAEKKKILADNGVTGQGLPAYGTQVLMNVINEIGALPTRNHRDVQFEGAKDISAEAMATPRATDGKKHLVTNQACFGCTIACGRISKIDQGHFTVAEQAAVLGRQRRPGVRSRLGPGRGQRRQRPRSAAVRQRAVQRARHGPDQLRRHHRRRDGAVRHGRADQGAARHRRQVRQRRRRWRTLPRSRPRARASARRSARAKRLCAKYGHPELSMSVKGQEFPAYDGRGIQGMGLAYATSNRGACHLRGYTVASEVLGIPVKTDPLTADGKPELVKAFQDATAAFDSPASASSPASPGAWPTWHRRWPPPAATSSRWRTWPRSASASGTWSATSTTAPASPQGRHAAQAPADRAGQDRPGQGPGQQAARDAAEVLRHSRLGPDGQLKPETRARLGL
jgi:aldehyde:ferredoxin oxidoreductase